jgi:hypothetical protein
MKTVIEKSLEEVVQKMSSDELLIKLLAQ